MTNFTPADIHALNNSEHIIDTNQHFALVSYPLGTGRFVVGRTSGFEGIWELNDRCPDLDTFQRHGIWRRSTPIAVPT